MRQATTVQHPSSFCISFSASSLLSLCSSDQATSDFYDLLPTAIGKPSATVAYVSRHCFVRPIQKTMAVCIPRGAYFLCPKSSMCTLSRSLPLTKVPSLQRPLGPTPYNGRAPRRYVLPYSSQKAHSHKKPKEHPTSRAYPCPIS